MPPEHPVGSQRFLVRQSLLDGDYRVVGYELGLRDRVPVPVLPGAESHEQARDEYLITSVIDLEYQRALGSLLTLLDLAPTTLYNPMLAELPAGKLAVTVPLSFGDLTGRCPVLIDLGIQPILVDDGAALLAALPAGCVWSRLDCARHDAVTLGKRAEHLRRLGVQHLIAANVDSEETLAVCRKLGFERFQGRFLSQPRRSAARKLESNVVQVMDLLNLARARAPIEQLEDAFKRNAALTYRLLRYINSPANGLDRSMQSIGQALMWLGHEPLYRWLTLLLFSSERTDGRGSALLRNALVRARFMENLGAERLDRSLRGGLFIVGILSQLDALLDMPLAEAVVPLHLPAPMAEALLEGKGPYAPYLILARACENFDQEAVERQAQSNQLSATEVNLAHVNALVWSETLEK
ncbi:MAG TPA: HDOD domain-containing protein [Parasulfuritortus sp.]